MDEIRDYYCWIRGLAWKLKELMEKAVGLPYREYDDELARESASHAEYLLRTKKFEHAPTELRRHLPELICYAEVRGNNYRGALYEIVFEEWNKSPAHKKTMGSFPIVGIGIAVDIRSKPKRVFAVARFRAD